MKRNFFIQIMFLLSMGIAGYAQDMRISHDQYYIVPGGNCLAGDVVGQFYINCTDTVFNKRLGNYTYSILSGNSGNAFSLNNSNGLITVTTPAAISYGNDFKLKIAVNIDATADTTFAVIHILHPDSVIFIDPSNTGTKDGSRLHPFTSWKSDIEPSRIKPGFAYLWKRGSTNLSGDDIFIKNNSAKTVFIGAYGSGARPIIDGRNVATGNGILVGSSWSCPADEASIGRNIRILDLNIKGFNADYSNGIRTAPSSYDVQLHRIFIEGGRNNGCIYLGKKCDYSNQNILVQDCEGKDNLLSHLLKAEAGGVTVINFWGQNAPHGTGISFPVSPGNTAQYFYLKATSETGINIRKENTHFRYGYITNTYRGAYLYFDGALAMYPHNSSIKDVIIDGTYSYGIELEDGHNITIEGVEIRNAKSPAIMIKSDMQDVLISKCNIHNNTSSGIEVSGNSTNIVLSYNIIYKNLIGINIKSSGNKVKLHNNVTVNNTSSDAVNSSGVQMEYINNVYKSITTSQWAPYSNNHNLNSEDCFVNIANGDFHIKAGSYVINNGKELGYASDFDRNKVPVAGNPDIGAFEFGSAEPVIDDTTVAINHAPVFEDSEFEVMSASGEVLLGQLEAVDSDNDEISYKIVAGNDDEIFSVDMSSGELLCLSDKIQITDPKSYLLVVCSEDNGNPVLCDSAFITVNAVPKTNNVYIDPENSDDPGENGTITHPFNSWEDVTWQEGNSYLQKCGTSIEIEKINVYASNVTLGSYGEGAMPVLNSIAEDYAISVFEKSNVTIKNLHINAPEAQGCIYFLGSICDSLIVEHCELEGSMNGVRIMDAKSIVLRYNTFTNNFEAIYSYAGNTEIYYNLFIGNTNAINVLSTLSKAYVYNNVFYNNTQGVMISYASSTLYNNIFYLNNTGDIALNYSADTLISDNNIYYPEQDGFIKISDASFNTLSDYRDAMEVDMNSFIDDPKFIDIYTLNFALQKESPAINKGKVINLEKDFLGNNVPFAGVTDIGLIEVMDSMMSVTEVDHYYSANIPLDLYPNPATDYVNVKLEDAKADVYKLQVNDISGKVIYTKNIDNKSKNLIERVDLNGYPKGTYLISLITIYAKYSGTFILF